jgi:PIN domain nuclease of toxin-antitoxin system
VEAVISLDTHVAVWLHAGELERLPKSLRRKLEGDQLVICPIVLLEMEYLREVNRLTVSSDEIFADLAADVGLRICDHAFAPIVRAAVRQTWTRDPFDRIIVAHALAAGYPLATKDDSIRENFSLAIWD